MTHALMSRADKPYGDVEYADPGYQSDKKPRYPVDTEDHARAAWAYIGKPENAGQYTPSQLANVKQRIRQAADKFGIDLSADEPGRAAFLDLFGADVFSRWTDAEHPHAPAGSSTGGEFVIAGSGGSSGASSSKAQQTKKGNHPPIGHKQAHKQAQKPAAGGALAYDPKTGRGPGYGMPNGLPAVHDAQRDLNRLGFGDEAGKPLRDDGKLGPHTTAAVKRAQRALGLKPDGIVTPALLQQLASLKEKPMPHRSALLDVCTRDFGFEFDERAKGDGRTLEGYAAVFNQPARIRDVGGDFEEVIRPGAFKRSLAARTPILQWDHGKDPRVGTVPIGAIEHLAEDSQGLHVRARLFDNEVVKPVQQAIEARAVKGMSFRFGVAKDGEQWTRRSGDIDLRDLTDLDTHELGPVAFPAYDHTSVSVRSLLDRFDLEERRALLRELAADERLAVDLSDLTGRDAAWSDPGGDPGAEPEPSTTRTPHLRQRLDEGALRARGILK
jgi:HK97 family phage prohead protease